MVERQLPKLHTWVRFPSPAPEQKRLPEAALFFAGYLLESVVMAANAMGVTMGFFFGSGVANINDIDDETQCLTGKRVVAVDIDGF